MTARIALVGYGFIAGLHADAIALLGDDVELVAVAGHRADRVAAFARERNIEQWSTDWRDICARPDVDLVIVATPNSLHFEQTMTCLELGKHVLVEKPMATTVVDARTMVHAARAAGRVLAVGHMWRHHPDVIALRERIQQGDFGQLVRTHGWGVHAGWGPSGWFVDPVLAGGGALIDMGIHAIDTARFLIGDPTPVRVEASIGYGAHGDHTVDDDGVVIVEWDNGIRSLVEFGWWQPELGGLEADTKVLGTAGSGRVWDMALPPAPDYVHCHPSMYATQLADVLDACHSGRDPLASAEVGLTALSIVELAYASSPATTTTSPQPNKDTP